MAPVAAQMGDDREGLVDRSEIVGVAVSLRLAAGRVRQCLGAVQLAHCPRLVCAKAYEPRLLGRIGREGLSGAQVLLGARCIVLCEPGARGLAMHARDHLRRLRAVHRQLERGHGAGHIARDHAKLTDALP